MFTFKINRYAESLTDSCFLVIIVTLLFIIDCYGYRKSNGIISSTTVKDDRRPKKVCFSLAHTLRARHKSCFLRPDTGPCRADIIQWYFDIKRKRCYRFYWGGCQGNGNRFASHTECKDYCFLNVSDPKSIQPQYCKLRFEYGTCFGHYYRWAWDSQRGACKRYLYSGCGGNQNNFDTLLLCENQCLRFPYNSTFGAGKFTTCMPLVDE